MSAFNIARWPALFVFLLAGLAAVLFALMTVNLFTEAMASLRFLRSFGWTAVEHGALRQAVELIFLGGLSLFLWLVFKCCEGELTERYRRWCRMQRRRGRIGSRRLSNRRTASSSGDSDGG